jgi:membrane protease YdiL (CAAX protease family)
LRRFLQDVLRHFRPTTSDIILVSIAAGLGEEIFFRAALQELTGIFPASALFALAHMGVVKKVSSLIALALFVFGMGLALGLVYERAGLFAAIIMHAVYDATVLLTMSRYLLESHSREL